MYAVIFKATVRELDSEYTATAERMRDLAIGKYGCLEFNSWTEGNNEIAISYWESESQILEWKQNIEHQKAQELGRSKWYSSYSVQVVEVLREYGSHT